MLKMMDEKCEKFLSKLAERFNGENVSNDQLSNIFKEAIDSLPKSKIKKELKMNSDQHFKIFKKCYEKLQMENPTLPIVLQDTNTVIGQILYTQKDQTQLKAILNGVVKKLQNENKSSTQIVSKLCNVALSFAHSNILYTIGHTLFSYFEIELDALLTTKAGVHELENIVKDMMKVLTLLPNIFHRRGFSQKKESDFYDVISAIISLYIDAKVNISILNSDSREIQVGVGNRLVELVNIVLGLNSSKFLDTLLQITSTKNPKSSVLLEPLYIYFFTKTTISLENMTVIKYLQILLAIRQSAHLVKNNSEFDRRIAEISGHCMAPEGFHAWVILRQKGSNLLDITTLTITSSPHGITEYLLNEAEIEIVEDFVDLYYEPKIGENQEKGVEEKSLEEMSDNDLFEIVTKGSHVTTLDGDATLVLNEEHNNGLDDADVDNFEGKKLFEISTKGSKIWDAIPDMLTVHKNNIDDQGSLIESDLEENNLLQETKHLLDDKYVDESNDGNSDIEDCISAVNTTEEMESADLVETNIFSKLRRTPKRKAKEIRNQPCNKLTKIKHSLSVIHEDDITECKTVPSSKTFCKTRIPKSRSDSESSTGSNHSYMTRSKRLQS